MKQYEFDNTARDKQQFIAEYVHKRMKNHNLPYGLEYYNKLYDVEVAAEKAWKRKQSKQTP